MTATTGQRMTEPRILQRIVDLLNQAQYQHMPRLEEDAIVLLGHEEWQAFVEESQEYIINTRGPDWKLTAGDIRFYGAVVYRLDAPSHCSVAFEWTGKERVRHLQVAAE